MWAETKWEMFLMDSDGLNKVQLTNNNSRDMPQCFSPKGDEILFQSNINGYYSLYIMKFF